MPTQEPPQQQNVCTHHADRKGKSGVKEVSESLQTGALFGTPAGRDVTPSVQVDHTETKVHGLQALEKEKKNHKILSSEVGEVDKHTM